MGINGCVIISNIDKYLNKNIHSNREVIFKLTNDDNVIRKLNGSTMNPTGNVYLNSTIETNSETTLMSKNEDKDMNILNVSTKNASCDIYTTKHSETSPCHTLKFENEHTIILELNGEAKNTRLENNFKITKPTNTQLFLKSRNDNETSIVCTMSPGDDNANTKTEPRRQSAS